MNDKLKESEKVKEPDEFFHAVGGNTAAIGLRIKVDSDINSAIAKAKKAGFDAEVRDYGGYKYLEISMKVDITRMKVDITDDGVIVITKHEDDVIVKLVKVAMNVSKKDYAAKSSGETLIEAILDDPRVQYSIEGLRKEMGLLQELSELKNELNELKKLKK